MNKKVLCVFYRKREVDFRLYNSFMIKGQKHYTNAFKWKFYDMRNKCEMNMYKYYLDCGKMKAPWI